MLNSRAAEWWFFTASLPSHAMVGVWSMRFWESARQKEGRGSDSQDRMDQTPKMAPNG
jgi:hypothetical protein